MKKERKITKKAYKHADDISLGAILTNTYGHALVGDARDVIERAIQRNNPLGKEIKKNIEFRNRLTYVNRSYVPKLQEFLERNGFDLALMGEVEKFDATSLNRRATLTGIGRFFKYPEESVPNLVDYEAKIPIITPISIKQREELTAELEKRVKNNVEVCYSPTQIMKMVNLTPVTLSKYIHNLGDLDYDTNGTLGYSSYMVLGLAKDVLKAEKVKKA